MKKALLLLVAFLSSLSFSACNGAAKGPIYNFSNSDGAALTPYAVEYEDTVYFSSFYDELYSYRDGTVTLLETEFNAHSMTMLDNYLYYCGTIDRNPDGFYRRKLSKDGKTIGEPEKLYNFSSSESFPNAAWTDGKHLFSYITTVFYGSASQMKPKPSGRWTGTHIPVHCWSGKENSI